MKKLSKTLNDITNSISTDLTTVVKLYLPNFEIRKFKIRSQSFSEFCSIVQNETQAKKPVLQYLDDEEEWVNFSSDNEWQTALSLSYKRSILRIRVVEALGGKKIGASMQKHEIRNLPPDFFGLPVN